MEGRCVTNVDCSIANDPDLKPIIEKFSKDESAFFAAFTSGFEKMVRLPATERSGVMAEFHSKLAIPVHENLLAEGSGFQVFMKGPKSASKSKFESSLKLPLLLLFLVQTYVTLFL